MPIILEGGSVSRACRGGGLGALGSKLRGKELKHRESDFIHAVKSGSSFVMFADVHRRALRQASRIRGEKGSEFLGRCLLDSASLVRGRGDIWSSGSPGGVFDQLLKLGVDVVFHHGFEVAITDALSCQRFVDDCFYSRTWSLLRDLFVQVGLENPFCIFERDPRSVWSHLFGGQSFVPHLGAGREAQESLAALRLLMPDGQLPDCLVFRLLGGDRYVARPLCVRGGVFFVPSKSRSYSPTRAPRSLPRYKVDVSKVGFSDWMHAHYGNIGRFFGYTLISRRVNSVPYPRKLLPVGVQGMSLNKYFRSHMCPPNSSYSEIVSSVCGLAIYAQTLDISYVSFCSFLARNWSAYFSMWNRKFDRKEVYKED